MLRPRTHPRAPYPGALHPGITAAALCPASEGRCVPESPPRPGRHAPQVRSDLIEASLGLGRRRRRCPATREPAASSAEPPSGRAGIGSQASRPTEARSLRLVVPVGAGGPGAGPTAAGGAPSSERAPGTARTTERNTVSLAFPPREKGNVGREAGPRLTAQGPGLH